MKQPYVKSYKTDWENGSIGKVPSNQAWGTALGSLSSILKAECSVVCLQPQ